MASNRTAIALLLHLAAAAVLLLLLLSPSMVVAVAPDGIVDSYVINSMDDDEKTATEHSTAGDAAAFQTSALQNLLESYIGKDDADEILEQKQNELHVLQAEFDAKMASLQRIRDLVRYEMGGLQIDQKDDTDDSPVSSPLDMMYDNMDAMSSKVVELVRRTERLAGKVGEYNRLALSGELGGAQKEDSAEGSTPENDAAAPKTRVLGLKERLDNVLTEELERRDRYNATLRNDDASPDGSSSSSASPYITIQELNDLLSPQKIIDPSEKTLQKSFSHLAKQLTEQHIYQDDALWRNRRKELTSRYEREFNMLERRLTLDGQCMSIPSAVELVGKALEEYYYDGTGIDLRDHASYEIGGSVVYELTSSAYVPPPRMDDAVSGGAMDEYERQKLFDEQTEEMYRINRPQDDKQSTMNKLTNAASDMNIWEWYTSYKFEGLRRYLPDDWERLLDYISDQTSKAEGASWSEYTPRGAIDALVPDYVYHAFGLGNDVNFGRAFGRTASPEVAISTGCGKSEGGCNAKPMGHCYPLSMRPEDDPALSLLSRHTHFEGGMEVMDEDDTLNLLVGPKYTVRLPYPVHIDAVTLEHRSFPLPKGVMADGRRGGESAPRWVRVMGFPPCPKVEEMEEGGEDKDECSLRGFDIAKPIDLGSVEYQRITVTGREDDYGGSDDDDVMEDVEDNAGDNMKASSSSRRRRSIQTFAVKGGKWKAPSSIFGSNDASEDEWTTSFKSSYDGAEPEQCDDPMSCPPPPEEEEEVVASMPDPEPEEQDESLPAGQCAPPKDEDSLPSCGGEGTGDSSSSASSSSSAERQVVAAVSFIIEENWGNSDFTCLYRVRVHGDAVSEI